MAAIIVVGQVRKANAKRMSGDDIEGERARLIALRAAGALGSGAEADRADDLVEMRRRAPFGDRSQQFISTGGRFGVQMLRSPRPRRPTGLLLHISSLLPRL